MYGATLLHLPRKDTDIQADTRINTVLTCVLQITVATLCQEFERYFKVLFHSFSKQDTDGIKEIGFWQDCVYLTVIKVFNLCPCAILSIQTSCILT